MAMDHEGAGAETLPALRQQLAMGLTQAHATAAKAEARSIEKLGCAHKRWGNPNLCTSIDTEARKLASTWNNFSHIPASGPLPEAGFVPAVPFGAAAAAMLLAPQEAEEPQKRSAYVPPSHLGLEAIAFGEAEDTRRNGKDRGDLEDKTPKNPFEEDRDDARDRREMRRQVSNSDHYLKRKLGDFRRNHIFKDLLLAQESQQTLYENQLYFSETAHAKMVRSLKNPEGPSAGQQRSAPQLITSPLLPGRAPAAEAIRIITEEAEKAAAPEESAPSRRRAPKLNKVPSMQELASLRKSLTSSQKKLCAQTSVAIPGAPRGGTPVKVETAQQQAAKALMGLSMNLSFGKDTFKDASVRSPRHTKSPRGVLLLGRGSHRASRHGLSPRHQQRGSRMVSQGALARRSHRGSVLKSPRRSPRR